MFLSREIDKKFCQIFTKMYMKNVYEKCKFKQILCCKYATNLKTTIFQWSLSNLGLLLLLFEFNNFSFSIKIIRPYHVTRTHPIAGKYTGHVIQTETGNTYSSFFLYSLFNDDRNLFQFNLDQGTITQTIPYNRL